MNIDISIHALDVQEFYKLKSVINNLTEWNEEELPEENKYYLSGRINIGDFRITMFSVNYKKSIIDTLKA